MLPIQNQSVKQSIKNLAKYQRFSTIQKMPVKFFESSTEASKIIANQIKALIEQKAKQNKHCILGLATGSTPVGVYRQLIKLHKEGLSFKNVITFNLDEYYPISHENQNSYHQFMYKNLFNHIDILKENINIPSGEVSRNQIDNFCLDYEHKIIQIGGIDLQILGIGRTGHIGFNQPPSSLKSATRLVHLDRITRMDNSGGFNGIQNVPKHAVTMGISTIMSAKRIILMAWSQNKANITQKTIEGQPSIMIPATMLHNHPNATFYLDRPASVKLSRFVCPWTIRGDIADPEITWDQFWTIKAVIWLSLRVKKPILRLTYEDYQDNGLSSLVSTVGNEKSEAVNLKTYKLIQRKITGWPVGGRPDKESEAYFNRVSLSRSKILIFSPHPDDDVICMASTIKKLVNQGHLVYIAYMTSGSYAVYDHDAKKYLDFFRDFIIEQQLPGFPQANKLFKQGFQDILSKNIGDTDSKLIRNIKKLIRRAEAKISVQHIGVKRQNIFSLDLPFYETGDSKKLPLGQKDYALIQDLFNIVQPDYIYAAGDLTDPHGTHRVCLQGLLKIIDKKQFKQDRVLLYRGAWQEWQIQYTHSIIPMSPEEIIEKKEAILKHQSQKDKPMFPGNDKRQFWQRSQERNRGTAELLRNLGFTSYEGAECFVTLEMLRSCVSI